MHVHDPSRPRPIKAVFVDVGGVLVVPNGITIGEALREGVPHATVDAALADRAHHVGVAALDAGVRGGAEASWVAYFTAWALTAGMAPRHLRAALPGALAALEVPSDRVWDEVRTGARSGLAALADLDLPLVVVSNSDGRVAALLERLRLCQVGPGAGVAFVDILDSALVGSTKPEPGIFHMACEAVGVQPADAVHVGDTECMDVTGAVRAGVRPVHLDPYGLSAGIDDGVDRVADLAGLADLVRRSWA